MKLFVTFILIISLCLCFVACGEDDEKTTQSTGDTTNGTVIEATLSEILGELAGGGYELPEDEF